MTMSDEADDGGPAFPHTTVTGQYNANGMSLRDWFAGQALNAMTISNSGLCDEDTTAEVCAALAYVYADAMLRTRTPEE